MILPTKYIQEQETILGVGAVILRELKNEMSISELWELVKLKAHVGNYERFILALDLLFILNSIDIKNSKLVKVNL